MHTHDTPYYTMPILVRLVRPSRLLCMTLYTILCTIWALTMGCQNEVPVAHKVSHETSDAKHAKHPIPAVSKGETTSTKQRLITLGGTVTEIIAALGHGENIVATDTSSIWPKSLQHRPKVGYFRKLQAEGIFSLKPTVIFGHDEIGPAHVLDQLKQSGVTVHLVPNTSTIKAARERILRIGVLLNEEHGAKKLVASLDAKLDAAQKRNAAYTHRPRALFIYARGPHVLMVSGKNTAAHLMLTLSGAQNAMDGFTGFKPMTPEAVVASGAEALILPQKGAESIGGVQSILRLPGVAQTPAGKARHIITVDDLALLGFGPRMGDAIHTLQDKLHPGAPPTTH